MQMTANLEGVWQDECNLKTNKSFSFTIISLCLHKFSIFSDEIQSFAPNLWRHHELHPITGGVKREVWNEKRENETFVVFFFISHRNNTINSAVKQWVVTRLEIRKNYSVLLTCTCVDYTIEVFQVLFVNDMGVPLQKQNVSTSQYK